MGNRGSVICALSIAVLLSVYVPFRDAPLHADESAHAGQVHALLDKSFWLNPFLTMLPGYHYTLFALATVTGWQTNAGLRFFSLLFGIGCVLLAWPLTRSVYRSLLCIFLPITFPFFFLVYTDIASLFSVLLSLYLIRSRRYRSAGLAAIAACVMRQNNVVWLVFLGLYAYVDKWGFTLDDTSRRWTARNLWPFALGVVLFGVFLVWNDGQVSLGDPDAHPTGRLHMSNIWFMLFLFALLFLPFALRHAWETLRRFWRHPFFWIGAIGVLLFYLASFTNTHHYNTQWGDYFIRNAILIWSTQNTANKIALFIPVSVAIAALISTKLERPVHYVLYPMSMLFLMPSWLVEQRYYIIPLTLFIVFGRSFAVPGGNGDTEARGVPGWIGWTWIALLMTVSVALSILMARGRLFL